MAAAYRATTFLILPFANANRFPRKKVVCLASSIPISHPSNLRRKRKNYLRPKILKTLTKPQPNPVLPELPSTIPIGNPIEQLPECPSNQFCGEEVKESESHEVSAGVINGSVGKFSNISVLKIGLYLVGAFVFQTICAVWILGSANSDHKDGILDSEDKTTALELGMNGNNKEKYNLLMNGSGILFSGKLGIEQGGFVYVDESELQEKIIEIQAMAREARERERLESKADDNGLADEDIDVVKTGIEKEVDIRLVKLRKSLQIYEKPAVSYLRKDGFDKDLLDVKEANGLLMFKKKYKFRSPLISSSDKPKGFQSSDDSRVSKMKNSTDVMGNEILKKTSDDDGVDLLDNEQQFYLPNDDLPGSDPITLKEDGGKKAHMEEIKSAQTTRKKLGKGKGRTKLGKAEPINGIPEDVSYGMPPGKAVKSSESSKLDEQSSPRFVKDQDTSTIANKGDLLSRNGSLKVRKVGNKQSTKGVWNKKSDTQIESWWLTLPYVLAILMRRVLDDGTQGLFTIKSTSHTKGDSSHVVAFEDRGDATNFCYLLQSFFEELGDFSTDVVPIPIKELDEAVKSHTMKVLVVKKGQLRLYAGQPLPDVEMALRSMVGQS